ncbi:hypothetical protein, partial [Acinetobacter baumannii]|uniref:hypothetical protein n=1 Tax=Acinetobacter baumannii TaxID=470 RepID=UPI000ADD7983
QKLVKLDCEDLIPLPARRDLLKMKSEYVKRFSSAGFDMFMQALQKLAGSRKLLHRELTGEGDIGKYFRSILEEVEEKAVPFLQRQLVAAKNALTTTQFMPAKQGTSMASIIDWWTSRFQERIEQLQRAIGWITTRQVAAPSSPVIASFPFYNWLEADEEPL